jgi:hypothetical protein
MRRPILVMATLVVGLFVAACAAPSGEPASSDGGGSGSSQGQPAQTNEPATSDGGSGGGGGGSGANGSVTFEITGDVNESGELPFLPILGGFFQQGDASYMPFANSDDSAGEVVFITLSPDGNVFAYGNGTVSVPAADCEWNVTRNDDGGAAGSFDCNGAAAISETGFGTVDIHGEFDAHD